MRKLAILVCAVAGMMLAQPHDTRRTIAGTVTDARSGAPVAHAKISLICSTPAFLQKRSEVLSKEDGAFGFANVPGGEFRCTAFATRVGFAPLENVAAGASRLDLKMLRQSILTLIALDENRQPIPLAQVEVLRQIIRNGTYQMVVDRQEAADDRGRARIGQLGTGIYRVCLAILPSAYMSSHHLTYDRICYSDGADSAHSHVVDLKTDETRNLLFDFKPARTIQISAHVSNSPSIPIVQISRTGPDGSPEVLTCNWDNAASRFGCPPVVPGEYSVEASYSASDMPGRGAAQSHVSVRKTVTLASTELIDVELSLQPYPNLVGSITSVDHSLPGYFSGVIFTSIKGESAAQIGPDLKFVVPLSPSESYRIRLDAANPWHIQSIMQGGKDITGGAIQVQPDGSWGAVEIVASQSYGSIDGSVLQANGDDCVVRVIERQDGILRVVATPFTQGAEHRFGVASLAPGEYFVLASRRSAQIPYLEAEYLVSRADVAQVHVIVGNPSHLTLNPVPDDSGFVR